MCREALLRIPLADPVKQYREIQAEVDSAIREVMESGAFILGPQVEALEQEIAEFTGAKYAVGVNSGTDALWLSLVAMGIGPGDEVITSPFTFVATVEAIALVGATPVFADIDPSTFNLCPDKAARVVTDKTRAIMPVDLYGQMADRAAFCELANRHGLELIWDAAQAIGCTFDGRKLGHYPGATTLSFYPTKNLGACGDAGMVITNDEGLRDRLRNYRFHGSGGGYIYSRVGYCSRLDALQAAILRVKLRHLTAWNDSRRRHAARYRELFGDARIRLPGEDPRARHVYHQFTVRSDHRDHLQAYLRENGVASGIYYPLALHLQEAYASLGYKLGDFPNAERATQEVLSIPIHQELTDDQIETVANLIRQFKP
jgi:dTDP-4-amino-4,6-dideoxygalactose transaminase